MTSKLVVGPISKGLKTNDPSFGGDTENAGNIVLEWLSNI